MPPLPLPAVASGGVTAAVVSALLREPTPFPSPVCQDLFDQDRFHWPSCIFGILVGLALAQLLELFWLAKQFLRLSLRQGACSFSNAVAIKNRLG